ncbi:MAG: aldehyde dehydrogenase family protein, partial [Sphingomonadales bacterium]
MSAAPIAHPDRFFIGGAWVKPSTADTIAVLAPGTEELFVRVAEAGEADIARAVEAARYAFDEGAWPRLSHRERADYLRAIAEGLATRLDDLSAIWPNEMGILHASARMRIGGVPPVYDYYAGLAETFAFEEVHPSTVAAAGLLVREPVGVVGAIIPWNGPSALIAYKLAPALLAGCTVVIKASPEAPGQALVLAEVIEAAGLPPGVVNVITADRVASEALVRDPRVDKIAFT